MMIFFINLIMIKQKMDYIMIIFWKELKKEKRKMEVILNYKLFIYNVIKIYSCI